MVILEGGQMLDSVLKGCFETLTISFTHLFSSLLEETPKNLLRLFTGFHLVANVKPVGDSPDLDLFSSQRTFDVMAYFDGIFCSISQWWRIL